MRTNNKDYLKVGRSYKDCLKLWLIVSLFAIPLCLMLGMLGYWILSGILICAMIIVGSLDVVFIFNPRKLIVSNEGILILERTKSGVARQIYKWDRISSMKYSTYLYKKECRDELSFDYINYGDGCRKKIFKSISINPQKYYSISDCPIDWGLVSATLRENLLGVEIIKQKRYESYVYSTQLESVLSFHCTRNHIKYDVMLNHKKIKSC